MIGGWLAGLELCHLLSGASRLVVPDLPGSGGCRTLELHKTVVPKLNSDAASQMPRGSCLLQPSGIGRQAGEHGRIFS